MKCIAKLIYDDKIWLSDVRTSDNKPIRLRLESGSFDALVERVKIALPEMLELNFNYAGEVELSFEVERIDILRGVNTA
jgi:hypothetical protein